VSGVETKWSFPSSVNAPCDGMQGQVLVTCSYSKINDQYDIVQLSLLRYNMVGIISPFFGNLTSLQPFKLFLNHLNGSIPPELESGQLISLPHLDLDSNYLTGSIPSEICQIAAFLEQYLISNQLTGSLPSEIGQLTSLEHVSLYSNYLTGSQLK
jgi:Leucine-rich repeat (LRR) protein